MDQLDFLFHTGQFPAEEREAIQHVGALLGRLEDYTANFQVALGLFDESYAEIFRFVEDTQRGNHSFDRQRIITTVVMRRQLMGARDAVMMLYHYGKTMEAIRRQSLRECPVVRTKVNDSKLRIAEKLFAKSFPHSIQLRHAISHWGELDGDLTSRGNHQTREDAHSKTASMGATSNGLSVGVFSRKLLTTQPENAYCG